MEGGGRGRRTQSQKNPLAEALKRVRPPPIPRLRIHKMRPVRRFHAY
jgi:hypothetical protein